MKPPKLEQSLTERIIALIEEARRNVATVANVALVHTYYEIGRMIIEDEQGGKERADYGKTLLKDLSTKLKERFGQGWSVENLTLMRKFYRVYGASEIADKPSTKSDSQEIVNTVYVSRHQCQPHGQRRHRGLDSVSQRIICQQRRAFEQRTLLVHGNEMNSEVSPPD